MEKMAMKKKREIEILQFFQMYNVTVTLCWLNITQKECSLKM